MTQTYHIRDLAIRDTDLIALSNDYIWGVMELDVQEHRFVTCMQSRIHIDDTDFDMVEIPVAEVIEKAGLSSGNHITYQDFEVVANSLLDKRLTLRAGKTFIKKSLMDTFMYDHDRKVFIARFSDAMKPYLLQLKNNEVGFTAAEEGNLFQFDQPRAAWFYQILKSHVWTKDKRPLRVKVALMKKCLKIENTHKNFNNFRERVLHVVQRLIETRNDIFFEFTEENNEGTKKITDVVFHIEEQIPNWKLSDKVIVTDNTINIEKSDDLPATLEKFGLDDTEIQRLIELYDFEYLVEKVTYIFYRVSGLTGLEKCAGYLKRALQHDYKVDNVEFILSDVAPALAENTEGKEAIDTLKDELIFLGVGKIIAGKLVKKYSAKRIREKIDLFEKESKKKNIRSAGAWLRRAIEEDYKDAKSSFSVANTKAAEKKVKKAKKAKKKEEKEEQKSTGYYEAIQAAIAENVIEKKRDAYLAKLVQEGKDLVFRMLISQGKTTYDDVLDYPVTRGFVLGSMAREFLVDEFHSLEAWVEHKTLSNDSPPLCD